MADVLELHTAAKVTHPLSFILLMRNWKDFFLIVFSLNIGLFEIFPRHRRHRLTHSLISNGCFPD